MSGRDLDRIKARRRFYAFDLPDRSRSRPDILPRVLHIHPSRRDRLRDVISRGVENLVQFSPTDVPSHEGYHSPELARHPRFARGFETGPSRGQRALGRLLAAHAHRSWRCGLHS